MKAAATTILCILAGSLAAQTKIDKSIPVQSGQKLKMKFDYPELVKISTWDKNEISVQGTVSINNGESDDAFKLEINNSGGYIYISNEIKDLDDLPRRITVERDGEKMTFRSKAEWRKYKDEHGGGNNTYSNSYSEGVDMDIILEIKVPKNMETLLEAVYGFVEVKQFAGPLKVEATYGGIDATLVESETGELIAETNYGKIYSDLNLSTNKGNIRDEDFHTYVSATPGKGPKYSFESPYGNVYLRKSK